MHKKILLIGSTGQLGSALFNILAADYNVTGLTSKELDIADARAVQMVIQQAKPDYIINAAAFNKVNEAENDPQKAFAVNAFGPYYLAVAAKQHGAIFVHVSTDYVFDGTQGFFSEKDAPHPLNVYGASKYSGEQLVEIASGSHYIIRTSALFGPSTGSQKINFVDRIVNSAKAGENLTVVSDQYTSPTYAPDLALKIKELLEKKAPYGLYHITNSGSCSWYEFAEKIVDISGLPTTLIPQVTGNAPQQVRRPAKSILENSFLKKNALGLLPPWEDAVTRYVTGLWEA